MHQVEELEEHARAALRVGRGPAGLRRLRICNRSFDLSLARESDFRLYFPGIRIENVPAAAGGSCHLLAADEMADLAHMLPPMCETRACAGSARVFYFNFSASLASQIA